MQKAYVRTQTQGAVATIRLDRPPANALGRAVSLELQEAARRVAEDPEVRAVVLWGGERIFAAGADIKAMAEWGPAEVDPDVSALEQACRDLEAIPKPVLAAVNGYALGGGCELALACDFRIAAEDVELALPEVRLGMIPGSGGTQRLVRLIGLARAKDAVMRGRRIGAEEALALGLVTQVVPEEQLGAAVDGLIAELSELSPLALATAKRVLNLAEESPLHVGLHVEGLAYGLLRSTHDFREGVEAFGEKRKPRFEGR